MKKRRKVVQAHIDAINEIIEEIIQGKINTIEATEYVNNRAKTLKIEQISTYTVISIVEELLKSNPEKLELYKKNRRHNSGNRSPIKISDNIKKQIIEQELPKIMKNEMYIVDIAKKYGIDEKTVRRIIEQHLQNDEKVYNEYKRIIYNNIGSSKEQRRMAREKREDIDSKEIVDNKEFVLLPIEEQKELIAIKFLKMKLKEKKDKGISNKQYVDRKIEELVKYFIGRNRKDQVQGNLTEKDVLYMLYRFTAMINYSIDEKIDNIIKYLEKDENFGYINTNHIIRTFPAVIGYSIDRTKMQVNILKENGLLDAIEQSPQRFMQSPQLMYALIEFAKYRHKTNNLQKVSRSNIFMANSNIKRLYKTSYEEIKQKYKLEEGLLDAQEIGKQTIQEQKDTKNKDKVEQEIKRQLNKKKDELVEK